MLVLAPLRGGRGGTQRGEQTAPVSATPQLPTVPPETTRHADDWPVPQGNLAAARNAAGSPIATGNIDELEDAWTCAVTAAGYFGSVTANPIVVGDTLYLQDMRSNIFA